jgi:internalin A
MGLFGFLSGAIASDHELIQREIAANLGKSVGQIDQSDYGSVTRLFLQGIGEFSDITAIGELKNLEELGLRGNKISDISSLACLRRLSYLSIHENRISDISALSNLGELENVDLSDNRITDVSPLANLKNIKRLCLHLNPIEDLRPLITLSKLEEFWAPFGCDGFREIKEALPNCMCRSYDERHKGVGGRPDWM